MSNLYLLCGLCSRQQADGLLSRGYWGHLEVNGGTTLRACPTCKEQHADWESRLRGMNDPGASDGTLIAQPESA
jgi:hypothetical protein